ncbi:MAG TPA: peptide ABC transporter substrate-binding protein [Herpetosiphonaceae bacterium]|nr:peptide ABC transporter substrate-binding protein [Herpetosiphonaceae bacterium]
MNLRTTLQRRGLAGLLLLALLAGCARSAGQQPAQAAPTAPADRATLPPPLPTATAAIAEAKAGHYVNQELGLAFDYPAGWRSIGEPNDMVMLQVMDGRSSLTTQVFQMPLADSLAFTDSVSLLQESMLQQFETATVKAEGPIRLAGRPQAWNSELSINHNGLLMKGRVVYIAHANRLLVFMFAGLWDRFDDQAGAIDDLLASIDLNSRFLYGISRDEALVLLSGESTNPRTYDPAHGGGDSTVFSGLVSFDKDFKVVPELAEGWDVSGGGTIYTFRLRREARFHNGRPLTSADVIYSWERAASPDTDSDVALTYLGDIVGVREMRAGTAERISGLKAIDDRTLQVTIDAPKPYFLMKLTYATGKIVDRANVESGPEWYRTPNGSGPYRLIRWDAFKAKIYQRNEDFYGEPPQIPFVIERLYAGNPLGLYETGEIDMTSIGAGSVERMRDPAEPMHAELRESVSMCTSYITFDVAQAPFDDLEVRQAFALAFDRQRYLDVIYNGQALPARGLFPPALPGYSADLRGQDYDPERARRLLAESRYGGAAGLPPIRFTTSGFGSDISASVAALAQMWQDTLGVTIEIENLEPNVANDKIMDGEHGQLISQGWCADYPDPENFADVLFHTGAEQNTGHYSNPEVDALLDQARVEQDVAARIGMYQRAEQIIVDDAPAIFIAHGIAFWLTKPYVKSDNPNGDASQLRLER